MINIFKTIRNYLVMENRPFRYLKYAIGEIILVVIGILIALQINNWNRRVQDHKRELMYLKEMRSNLEQDTLDIEEILQFNERKLVTIQNLLKIFPDSLTNQDRVEIILSNLKDFPQTKSFDPKQTSFRNLINAESINLISNKNIRNNLIDYYERDYEKYQERVWIMNRRIIDDHYHKFLIREYWDYSTEFPPMAELEIHKDRKLFTDLYGLMEIVKAQTAFIILIKERNEELREQINYYLKSS